ncbi:hypothetical protein BD324DRAFT_403013 [Kockovaella imperatae]|uniref:Uncharacterized protein n=1 Tax=Kockovaella imperatae TaxID=4999 RepID=A0A1Y1UK26_9TREE|nr:hypothetical protein BD324DRAFT_403013 [Kockovaella imperatae]ORX37854.1 hypothetical protein BD324DRAFT_403013 [Kockovaella imperatae]
MPHTHPSPKLGQGYASSRPSIHNRLQSGPGQAAQSSQRPHAPRHTLSTSTTSSSRYLSPIQEQRILSWRDNTVPSKPADSPRMTTTTTTPKIKSAPASLAYSKSTPTGSSVYSKCPLCAGASSCSCSPYEQSATGAHQPRRQKSYYKNSKTKRGTTPSRTAVSPLTPSTPASSPHPQSAKTAHRQMSTDTGYSDSIRYTPDHVKGRLASHYASEQGTSDFRTLPPAPPTYSFSRPNKNGMPSPEQVKAYSSGSAPTAQYGPPPTVPLPEPQVVPPPAGPAMQPQLPRIAGVRDPVSQNYFRNMFPPAAGPFGLQPGLHPPQLFGMPAGRPMG